MNSTWDIPVGRERKYGLEHAAVGRRDRRRLDGVDDLPGALGAATSRRSSSTAPIRFTRRTPDAALDGVGQFGEAWRPDVNGNPNVGGTRGTVLRRDGLRGAGARLARQREEGQPQRPGHLDRQLRRSTRTSSGRTASTVEFTALLDNAFNHPQFFVRPRHRRVHGSHRLPAQRQSPTTARPPCSAPTRCGNAEGFCRRPGRPARAAHAVLKVSLGNGPVRDDAARKKSATESELEDLLSEPTDEDVAAVARLEPDILILGAGGKMGPSLARRVQPCGRARRHRQPRARGVAVLVARGARESRSRRHSDARLRLHRRGRRSAGCRASPTCCSSPAGSSARRIGPISPGRPTPSCPRGWPSISATPAWWCSRPATSIRW